MTNVDLVALAASRGRIIDAPTVDQVTAEVVRVEGEVDSIHDRGLKGNFARARDSGDTLRFVVVREIYKHLERIADEFEDVANQIDGIVVDHA